MLGLTPMHHTELSRSAPHILPPTDGWEQELPVAEYRCRYRIKAVGPLRLVRQVAIRTAPSKAGVRFA